MGCGQSQAELTAERIGKALIEALNQAARVAVSQTSQKGVFSATPALKISIPEDGIGAVLNKAKALPGIGDKVQELEDKMNEGAELACGQALNILQQAVGTLNFNDARAILDGAENAATQYFIQLCREPLFKTFKPIVDGQLGELGVVSIYDTIIEAYNKIPFADKPPTWDLEEFVTNAAMKGLFTVFEQEEAKIRGNPAGAPSELLQDVFSQSKSKKQ